jgi:hypothetical protein
LNITTTIHFFGFQNFQFSFIDLLDLPNPMVLFFGNLNLSSLIRVFLDQFNYSKDDPIDEFC